MTLFDLSQDTQISNEAEDGNWRTWVQGLREKSIRMVTVSMLLGGSGYWYDLKRM